MPQPIRLAPLRRLRFPRSPGRLEAVPFFAFMGWTFGDPDGLVDRAEIVLAWLERRAGCQYDLHVYVVSECGSVGADRFGYELFLECPDPGDGVAVRVSDQDSHSRWCRRDVVVRHSELPHLRAWLGGELPEKTVTSSQEVRAEAQAQVEAAQKETEKADRKAAKAQAVTKAAKDLRDAWVASAFYDRQDPALAEALIDALDNQ